VTGGPPWLDAPVGIVLDAPPAASARLELLPMMRTARASWVALLAAAFACGGPEPLPQEAVAPSPLMRGFALAAAEYQVPEPVLLGIAYVETRVRHLGASPSLNLGYGVMNLVEREDWDALGRAQAHTGLDRGRLKVDPQANVRGAAAFLRELFEQSLASYPNLRPNALEDWWHAVSLYGGLSSASEAHAYAAQVFGAIEQGFSLSRDDGQVALAPTFCDWRKHAPIGQQKLALKEYPGAYQWVRSPNYSSGRSSYTNVVIHTVQGSYQSCISWFKNPSSNVSAHYVVRSSDGQITQMVEHKDSAWHASCYNGRAIGIEHEGYAQDPGAWYTEAMYAESAKLTRWIADRHGIPKTRARIIGHAEVPSGCNPYGKWDPGSGWNWTRYMALVNGTTSTAGDGLLKGVIFTAGDTQQPVAGAVVTVAGQSHTTLADGEFQFSLPPGTYTAQVDKTGYTSAQVTRTVVSGGTVWGSMEVNPTGNGILKGYVYRNGNTADRLAGATVTLSSGQSMSTGPDGLYALDLPAGTYTATATKTGYYSGTATRTVVQGGTTWGSIDLVTDDGQGDRAAPQVSVLFPADGSTHNVAVLSLQGRVTDNAGPIAKVFLRMNGGGPTEVAVTDGAFSAPLKLASGENLLQLSAQDAAGNVGTASVTVRFRGGVSGLVYHREDPAARIADARVRLLRAGTGELAAQTQTRADGTFEVDLPEVGRDYILAVKAQGFLTAAETLTVSEEERLKVEVPLTPGQDVTQSEVWVRIVEPQDGAVVQAEAVAVYGAVEGLQLAAVTVNGAPAELLGAGGFAATVALAEGRNDLEAVAIGVDGERVAERIALFRGAGSSKGGGFERVRGGCAAVPGQAALWALVLLSALLRQRR
jgi:hypothetical protein